jgi:hypothetical protein
MVIDMTGELAPILYGILGITLASCLSIVFAVWHATRPQRQSPIQDERRPVLGPPPRGVFVAPRFMHAASSPAH